MKIGQKFSTSFNSQLILFLQYVIQQNLWHFTYFLLLHSKFRHKNSQNSKVVRSDVSLSNMMEHFRYVDTLILLRIEANIDNKTIKCP